MTQEYDISPFPEWINMDHSPQCPFTLLHSCGKCRGSSTDSKHSRSRSLHVWLSQALHPQSWSLRHPGPSRSYLPGRSQVSRWAWGAFPGLMPEPCPQCPGFRQRCRDEKAGTRRDFLSTSRREMGQGAPGSLPGGGVQGESRVLHDRHVS